VKKLACSPNPHFSKKLAKKEFAAKNLKAISSFQAAASSSSLRTFSLQGLTAGFEMGPGVSPAAWPLINNTWAWQALKSLL